MTDPLILLISIILSKMSNCFYFIKYFEQLILAAGNVMLRRILKKCHEYLAIFLLSRGESDISMSFLYLARCNFKRITITIFNITTHNKSMCCSDD